MKKWKSYLQCYLLSYITTELLCCLMIVFACVYRQDFSLFVYFAWCQIGMPFASLWTMLMLYFGIYVQYKENKQ